MGYLIKPLPYKKRTWKLQHQSYIGGRAIKDISVGEYSSLGFSPSMTIEEARARKDSINAQEHLRTHETRRVAIIKRLQKEDEVLDAFLHPLEVAAFENEVLFSRAHLSKDKIESHWRAAKRVIAKAKLEPREWAQRKEKFYDIFSRDGYSPAYVKKVLRLINMWGAWRASRAENYFAPIAFPRGLEKQRIADAFFETGNSTESLPLTPDALAKAQSSIPEQAFSWLYLSLWLGLRPVEINLAKALSHTSIKFERVGKIDVVAVYQSKLTSVDRDKRWKYIPLLEPEQKLCLALLKEGEFKHPGTKMMHNHFPGVTLYGGRKGFTDLMLARGYPLEKISAWLGHMSIERTWRSYKDKNRVSL